MNLLIIGDPHAHPDYDNSRFTALGKFIAKERPEVIVCIGDMADMPSLSSYDKGTKGFEGRRYKKDVKAVIDAQEKLFAPIKKVRGYKPKLHMCLGNHEDRITRAVNTTPELEGAIGIEDLKYKEFGWKVTPFKKCVTIKGITFSHYFSSGVMGRPISSVHIGYALITKLHCSAVQGHSHYTTTLNKQSQTVKIYLVWLLAASHTLSTQKRGVRTLSTSGGEALSCLMD